MNTQRITDVTQQWFLAEPLLFGAWSSHRLLANDRIDTIRVNRGLIEFNPAFVDKLDGRNLREVMKFEALRIILKHPYERRKPNSKYAYEASNLALRECTPTLLPMPTAQSRFGTNKYDKKFLEYYYDLLCATPEKKKPGHQSKRQSDKPGDEDNACQCSGEADCECPACRCNQPGKKPGDGSGKKPGDKPNQEAGREPSECASDPPGTSNSHGESVNTEGDINEGDAQSPQGEPSPQSPPDVSQYCEADIVGVQNATFWDYDQLITESINDLITEIETNQSWGTVAGGLRELILASRTPRLDYRRVLSSFRASILSTNRRLTRMKPNRRYGFQFMGSRRDFSTKILFAIDVSGSVSTTDVRNAFGIINRLFKYGIESIDVIWFDTDIRNQKPLSLKRARQTVAVEGRGGTCFQPLMDYLDEHRDYDGLIVFTDGIAPVPDRPKLNRRTRVVWLFNHESNWKTLHKALEGPGMFSAFVMAD